MSDLGQLDLDVAEQVMGFDRMNARVDPMVRNGDPQYFMGYPIGHDFAPYYSIDIAAAFQVVEKMRLDGWSFACTLYEGKLPYASFCKLTAASSRNAEADSLPEAICRAALECVKEKAKAASS